MLNEKFVTLRDIGICRGVSVLVCGRHWNGQVIVFPFGPGSMRGVVFCVEL